MIEASIFFDKLFPGVREVPYKRVNFGERQAAGPMANRVRKLAFELLQGKLEVHLDAGPGHKFLGIMGALQGTVYEGADVLVEKWGPDSEDPEANDREFSYAFYSDTVINRPNHNLGRFSKNPDGRVEIKYEPNPDEPETYEVKRHELEDLFEIMKDCRQYRLPIPF